MKIPHLSRRTFLAAPIAAAVAGGVGSFTAESLAASIDEPAQAVIATSEQRRKLAVTSLRTYEGGFHNGPTTHFDHFDPEDFMRKARAAHAGCIVVQAKSMWGYAYYDTKVGAVHPVRPAA